MKLLCIAPLLLIATSAVAQEFSIPAEEFDWHTFPNDMSGFTEDAEFEYVRVLGVNDQLHIRHWIDAELYNFATNLQDNGIAFEVCVTMANLDDGVINSVRINHPNPDFNEGHMLESDQYQTLCSEQGEFSELLRSAGLRVLSSSQGPVEVRSVLLRAITEPGQDPGPGQNSSPLTTETVSSWELDLFRSPRSYRDNGRPTYVINEQTWAVLTIGDVVYVGGEFENIRKGNVFANPAQKYIAAFDRHTGEPIPDFDIELDGAVFALATSPNNDWLYIGGDFNTANGQTRRKFAAYEVINNKLTLSNFRPKRNGGNIVPNRALRDIAVTHDRLYLAGLFTKFGGNEDHAYVAALDRDSGEIVKDFKPRPNRQVRALLAGGNEGLWIGGDFKTMNGTSKQGLALVNHDTGELETSPDVPYPIIDLAATSTQLFVASGGQNRTNRFTGNVAGAFDRATLEVQWELQGDGNVQAVDVDDGKYVYFGGHYERFRYIRNSDTDSDGQWIREGGDVDRVSRHDKVTGEIDLTWLPYVDGIRSVNGVDVTSDSLSIVGDFFDVGGDTFDVDDPRREDHRGFAIFNGATD